MERTRSAAEMASLATASALEALLTEPLPSPWSYGVMEDGRVFFVNEEEHLTTWLHPMLNHPLQTGYLFEQDLPQGWEMNFASGNVPYYIDHINHSTTFQFPSADSTVVISRNKTRKPSRFQRSSSKRKSGKQKVIEKMASVKRDIDAPVSIKGWLNRQEASGPLKSWKRRWCVLSNFCLFFYKGSEEGHVLGTLLLPSFKINPCVKDEYGISRRCAFKAEHENVKTSLFFADTEEEMEMWIEMMRAAANAQFHSYSEGDSQHFQRSQSHNAINSSKLHNDQDLSGPSNEMSGPELSQYGRRQNSMPCGINLVRQNTDESMHHLEVQDTDAGLNQLWPGAVQYAGRNNEIRGDPALVKNSNMYGLEQSYSHPEVRNVSSSSDNDFLDMKDLNLSHPTSGALGRIGKEETFKQQVEHQHNQYYQPTAKNQSDMALSSNVPAYSRARGKDVDMQMMYDKDELNEPSTGKGRLHQLQPQQDEPRGYIEGPDSSQVTPLRADASQKPSGLAKASDSAGPGDSRYLHSPDRNAAFYQDRTHSSGNAEMRLLDEIRNQSSDRISGDSSRAKGFSEVGHGVGGKLFDHSLNQHGKDAFPGSSDLRMRERKNDASGKQVDAWSAKQLDELEVQKPLSRVEEWTLKQQQQQQAGQAMDPRIDGRQHKNSEFEHKARNDAHSYSPPVEKFSIGNSVPGPARAQPIATTRANLPTNLNSFEGAGLEKSNQMLIINQVQGNQMQGKLAGSEKQGLRNISPENQIQGSQPSQDNQTYRSQPPQDNQTYRSQPPQDNQTYRSQIQEIQKSQIPESQRLTADNHQIFPTSNFTLHPLLTSSQSDLADSGQNVGPSFHMENRMRSRQNDVSASSIESQAFADVNRLLANHAKLCKDVLPSINQQQQLSVDDLIGRLIQLRRSQTKLEENRYWLLGHIHHQQYSHSAKDTQRLSSKTLQDKLVEIEKEIANTVSIIADLDGKLISLRTSEQMEIKLSSSSVVTNQNTRLEQLPVQAPAGEKQPSSSSMAASDLKNNKTMEKKLQELQMAQRQVEQESVFVNNLREEKLRLEKALPKAVRDEELEKDPNHLMRIHRQKQAIDRELYSLQTKLTYAVRNLDEVKNKCVLFEQDVAALKKKQVDDKARGGSASAVPNKFLSPFTSAATAEETMVKPPNGCSDETGSGNTYLETDLDTGQSRDLALPKSKPASGNQISSNFQHPRGSRINLKGMEEFQNNTAPAAFVRNKELSARSSHSSFPPGKGTSLSERLDAGEHSSADAERKESWKGRSEEMSREPYRSSVEERGQQYPQNNFTFKDGGNNRNFSSNTNTGNLPPSSSNIAVGHVSTNRQLSGNAVHSQQWHDKSDRDRAGFQSENPKHLQDVMTHRAEHNEFSHSGIGHTERPSDVSSIGCGQTSTSGRIMSRLINENNAGQLVYSSKHVETTELRLNMSSVQQHQIPRSDSEIAKSQGSNNKLLGSGLAASAYDQSASTSSSNYRLSDRNPSKPLRLAGERWEWQKETELKENYKPLPLHNERMLQKTSKTSQDSEQRPANARLMSSSSEEDVVTTQRPRSRSLPRGADDDQVQQNFLPQDLPRNTSISGSQGAEVKRGQSSPTGDDLGPRDHIRRLSGFFTPKPFKGGGTGAGSARTPDEVLNLSSKDTKDSASHQDLSYDQHLDGTFHAPQKNNILEHCNEDADNKMLSPEEMELRREKSEKLRKMVAAQSLQQFSKGELTTQMGGLHYRLEDERRRREQMLGARQMLAKEVTRRTRQGSDNANKIRTVEELLKDSDDGQYL